jgi:hypothetical protein
MDQYCKMELLKKVLFINKNYNISPSKSNTVY